MSRPIVTLADQCEAMGLPRAAMVDLIRIINAGERAEMAAHRARANRGNPRFKARTNGRARLTGLIPPEDFARWVRQKNFGWAGMRSAEGRKELFKAHPEYAVETVSGKCTVGYTGANRKVVKRY